MKKMIVLDHDEYIKICTQLEILDADIGSLYSKLDLEAQSYIQPYLVSMSKRLREVTDMLE